MEKVGGRNCGEFMVIRQIRQRFPHQSFPPYGSYYSSFFSIFELSFEVYVPHIILMSYV